MARLSERILKFSKVIAVNLVVTAGLLLVLNWLCGVILRKTADPSRAELPNYQDERDVARKIFVDYDRVKHRYEPFSEWRALSYDGETTHIDQQGLRIVPGAPATGLTVRFFGGSTMWGEGSDDARTIPAYVQSQRPEWMVANHSQLAYNSMQNLTSLIVLLSKGDSADVVVFYDGVNDAAFLCPTEISVPGHRLVPSFQKRIYGGSLDFALIFLDNMFISNMRRLVQRGKGETPGSSAYNCENNPEKVDAIANGMIRNWEMAHELVTTRGGEFIAVLQPMAYVGNPKTDHVKLDETLGRNMVAVYRVLQEKLAAKNYPWVINLTSQFDGDQYIYIDFCHVSPAGNKLIADKISDFVLAQQSTDVK